MSDLQIALIIIGLLVLAAIYGYGQWQQREYNRRRDSASVVRNHLEPRERGGLFRPLSEKIAQSRLADQFENLLDHPLVRHNPEPPELEPQPVSAEPELPEAPLVVDTCVLFNEPSDLVMVLRPEAAVTAAALNQLWPHRFDYSKPLQVCGRTRDLPHWERVIPDSPVYYTELRVALQLVDRSGLISESRALGFVTLVQSIANTIPATCDLPELALAYQKARELDQFCVEVDKMVGINLMPVEDKPLTGPQIAQVAAELGLSLESDGAYHLLNLQGQSLFSLINQQDELFQLHTLPNLQTAGITLLLDVPRAADPLGQFDQMVQVALKLADALDLDLVDDERQMLSEAGVLALRDAIASMKAHMLARGMVPGSVHTRRLFS